MTRIVDKILYVVKINFIKLYLESHAREKTT